MKAAEIKHKTCAATGCDNTFRPFKSTERVCSIQCAISFAQNKMAKKTLRETRRLKREFRSKDVKFWKAKARTMCHKYIRTRDQKEPCISCGCVSAGQWDAGHFKTRGAKTELQFHEWNIHKQCSVCNNYRSAHDTDYRDNLIKKIGLKGVEFLEGPHQHYKWTIDDYKAVYDHYKGKLENLDP